MSILMWEKPEKILSDEEWKAISADGAPPGVYTPNMSPDDARRFKAKVVKPKTGPRRVEIRVTVDGVQVVVMVAAEPVPEPPRPTTSMSHEESREAWVAHSRWRNGTPAHSGFQMSMNGTVHASTEWWVDLTEAVAEARVVLGILEFPVRVGETIEVRFEVTPKGADPMVPVIEWRPFEVVRLSREGFPVVRHEGSMLHLAPQQWRKPR